MGDAPQLLSAERVRKTQIIDVDLGDGTFVRARRSDLSSMLFEGTVPTPLLAAAQKFIDNREMSPTERLEDLDAEVDRPGMLEVLRQHAIAVVIEPRVVPFDDKDPTHLPVDLLTLPQLLAIWNQTAVIPKVGAAEAATFRLHQRPDVESLLRARKVVRSSTEPVDVDRRGA